MAAFSERRRFLGTLLREPVDRFPFFDLEPAEETVERWRREGLGSDGSVAEVFGLELHHLVGLDLRSRPLECRRASPQGRSE